MQESPVSEMVSIRFTPTKDDYVRVMRTYFTSTRRFRRVLKMLALSSIGFGLVYIVAHAFDMIDVYAFLFALLMVQFPFFAFWFLVVSPAVLGRQVRRNERLRSEVLWEADDNHFLVKDKFVEVKRDWGSLDEVVEARDLYLLSPGFAFVPKRAFESPQQEGTFRDLVTRNVDRVRLDGTARRGPLTPIRMIVVLSLLLVAGAGFAVFDTFQEVREDPAELEARSHLEQAVRLADSGQWDAAIEECTTAIGLYPGLAPAYLQRAAAYNETSQYELAIADCKETYRLDARLDEAFLIEGIAYLRLGDMDSAGSAFVMLLMFSDDPELQAEARYYLDSIP